MFGQYYWRPWRRVLDRRQEWVSGRAPCSDREYLDEVAPERESLHVVLCAVRRAIATRCGVDASLIRPDDSLEAVMSIMGDFSAPGWRQYLREPCPGEWDPVEFEINIEVELGLRFKRASSRKLEQLPPFGSKSIWRRYRRRLEAAGEVIPERFGEWALRASELISSAARDAEKTSEKADLSSAE